jgi:hypothetical protein
VPVAITVIEMIIDIIMMVTVATDAQTPITHRAGGIIIIATIIEVLQAQRARTASTPGTMENCRMTTTTRMAVDILVLIHTIRTTTTITNEGVIR